MPPAAAPSGMWLVLTVQARPGCGSFGIVGVYCRWIATCSVLDDRSLHAPDHATCIGLTLPPPLPFFAYCIWCPIPALCVSPLNLCSTSASRTRSSLGRRTARWWPNSSERYCSLLAAGCNTVALLCASAVATGYNTAMTALHICKLQHCYACSACLERSTLLCCVACTAWRPAVCVAAGAAGIPSARTLRCRPGSGALLACKQRGRFFPMAVTLPQMLLSCMHPSPLPGTCGRSGGSLPQGRCHLGCPSAGWRPSGSC